LFDLNDPINQIIVIINQTQFFSNFFVQFF